jgi:hypothetical protein
VNFFAANMACSNGLSFGSCLSSGIKRLFGV